MSDFSTPQKVLQTIQAGDDAAWLQSENRRKINEQANGSPPLPEVTAKDLGIKINVNWGELTIPLAHARRAYEDAVIGQERYFKVTLPLAPPEKAVEWSLAITTALNDALKEDEDIAPELDCVHQYRISALVCHGIAPVVWYHPDDIIPEFVSLSDLRIPTDTVTSFKNLTWFAVRQNYTPGELVQRTSGENVLPGWNKEAIRQILKQVKELNFAEVSYDWEHTPEKCEELIKQNMGFFSSDAMPTIPLWHFYFQSQDGDKKWYMVVVPDRAPQVNIGQDKFIYESEKPMADRICYLLHCQFGDINNAAPFLVHSVRSLGFMLMDPCFWSNLTRCRLLQHLHENMNMWLRVDNPADRERAQKVELFDKAVVPKGVSIVPQTERHQVDQQLADSVMANLKQLQNEAAASYTHELDTGTQKEQTATETMANLQRVNAMMSGLLSRFFRREKYLGKEICRRLCLKNTTNEKARKFQKTCQRAGIPPQYMNTEDWRVEAEKPMGNGNPTMALMSADKMMELRPALGPDAQQEVLHEVVAIVSGDPRKAQRWVPIDKQAGITNGQEFAQSIFGTLMQGVQVRQKEGLSPIDQVETLLGLMAGKCASIQQTGGVGSAESVAGLQNVGQFIGQLIQQLAQNPQEKQRVKQYSDDLGKLMNEVKAFAQRQQEAAQQEGGNGFDPKALAAIQGKMMMDRTKAKNDELKNQQKLRHKELAWQSDQKRKDAQTSAEIGRMNLRAVVEAKNMRMKAFSKPNRSNESK